MSDIRIINIPCLEGYGFDLARLQSGAFDETQELATGAIIALATDRRAEDGDDLPGLDDDQDRRGWWGDHKAEEIWNGWPIGSRLWLLKRAKITGAAAKQGATKARAEFYIREALQPFISKGIASRIDVEVTRTQREALGAIVTIWRGPKAAVELRFQSLWKEIEE